MTCAIDSGCEAKKPALSSIYPHFHPFIGLKDMARPLNTPITDDGLTSIRFFNGRVLSAADLETEQAADRRRRAQLGRAQGTGTVHGLHVRPAPGDAPTALRVTKGLAINRAGSPVELFVDVEVSVVDANIDPEPATGGDFMVCEALPSVTATGTGAYLLVACPATKRRELVPRAAMGDGGMAGSCGPKYRVEGVRFRLVHLDTSDDSLVPAVLRDPLRTLMAQVELSPAARSRRRNLLAHWCLGTADARQSAADLFDRHVRAEPPSNEPVRYGPLDALRMSAVPGDEPTLTPHDVPLALFVWDEDRVTTVDMWAVRRRIHRLAGAPEPITDRRHAEGEAAFRQFQGHIGVLVQHEPSGDLLDVRMSDYFRFLPALCMVPLVNSDGGAGVLPETFLEGYPARSPVYAEGARVGPLMAQAMLTPAVSLAQGTALRTYYIRENAAAREEPATVPERPQVSPVPYLVLASGYLPRIGDPRYDLSHWDFAHYPHPADG